MSYLKQAPTWKSTSVCIVNPMKMGTGMTNRKCLIKAIGSLYRLDFATLLYCE